MVSTAISLRAVLFTFLLLPLLLLSQLALAASPETHTVHLGYALPPYSAHTEPLCSITYTLNADGTRTTALKDWTPPPAAAAKDVQIGLLASGTSSVKAGLAPNRILVAKDLIRDAGAVVQLRLEEGSGRVWAVGVSKRSGDGAAASASKGAEGPWVEVLREVRAPAPAVNRPVVLNPEGKVEQAVPEKSFVQKYWWVLLAVTFVAMTAGGGDK